MNDINKKINDLIAEATRLEALETKARNAGLNIATMRHYEALRVTNGKAFTAAQAQAIPGLSQAGVSQLLIRLVNTGLATRIKVYKSATLLHAIN